MADELDTVNRQLVGMNDDDVVVLMPRQTMTKAEALSHAAWLAVLADPMGERFAEVLAAVRNT